MNVSVVEEYRQAPCSYRKGEYKWMMRSLLQARSEKRFVLSTTPCTGAVPGSETVDTMPTEGEVFQTEYRAKDAANKSLSPYIVELSPDNGYCWFSSEKSPPQGSHVVSRWRWTSGHGYQRQGWEDVHRRK
jgi:hypothetical protein